MENRLSRSSIILKNLNSPYFEQAIFILKKEGDADGLCEDIVDEAQKIIDSFIRRKAKRKLRINRMKTVLTTSLCITSAGLVFFLFTKLF